MLVLGENGVGYVATSNLQACTDHSTMAKDSEDSRDFEAKDSGEEVCVPKPSPCPKEDKKVCGLRQDLGEGVLCPSPLTESLVDLPTITHQGPRLAMSWWELHAPASICMLIKQGVQPRWHKAPNLPLRPTVRNAEQIAQCQKLLKDYQTIGAVKQVSLEGTKFLVPWFVLAKQEGEKEKLRLICDCREINQHLETKPFRLENWRDIFPFLRKGMWAAKVDLKDAYFHLALGDELKPYVRLQVGEEIWEFQAACFGLSPLPQVWMSVMKVFLKRWRSQGMLIFIYLDDILLLGGSKTQVARHLATILKDLKEGGMKTNLKKSVLEPVQQIDHLGFQVDLVNGILRVPPHKLKTIRKELGKLLIHKTLSCRKMAAILGQVRSFLMAMPFLRAFTDTMVQFVSVSKTLGWDHHALIPEILQNQVREIKTLTTKWAGRPFLEGKCDRHLHSDSSTHAWGGVDLKTGVFVQEFWRERSTLHINVKELEAAIATIKSLARPKEKVILSVDNTVAFSYLKKKGGG